MNYQWSTPIDKLMLKRGNAWIKYESKCVKTHIRIHYDQLLLTSETKVLESINMNSKIKGIYKGDVLMLIVSCTGQEIRKLRFRILANASQCYSKLGEHFLVVRHNSPQSHTKQMTYRNLNEVLSHALNNSASTFSAPLPPNYVDFMKLCLLDPLFPQYVREIEKLLIENNIVGTL